MVEIPLGRTVSFVLPNWSVWLCAAVLAAILVGLLAYSALRRRAGRGSPLNAKPLLTRSETEFFHKLVAVADQIGGLHVCPQVSMGAVMDVDRSLDARERLMLRNRFSSKIIDFVLIDRQAKVRLLIELDDPSHFGREDQDRMRDSMTSAAGIGTLRIPDGRRITAAELSRRITENLPVTH